MLKSLCLFIFLIFLFSLDIKSQELDSLFVKRSELYEASKYEDAIIVARKISAILKPNGQAVDYGNALFWEGLLYKQLKKNDEAALSYKNAMVVFKNVDDQLQSYAAASNALGVLYGDNNKITAAENAYFEALNIYKSFPGDTAAVYISVQENLITLYTNNDQFEKLGIIFSNQIAVLRKVGKIDSLLGIKLNQLAVNFHKQKLYSDAKQNYLASKKVLKITVGIENPLYMKTLENLKVLYNVMAEKDSTITNLKEINQIQLQTLGPQSIDYALSTNELAIIYQDSKEPEKAKPYYQIALKIFKEVKDMPNYFTVLENASTLYKELKDIPLAIAAYEELLQHQKEGLPETKLEYGSTLNKIGVFYSDNQNQIKAAAYFEEAIKVWGNDTSYAENKKVVTNNLYTAYSILDEYKKMIAIDLSRIIVLSGKNDINALVALNFQLGNLYQIISLPDSAIHFYKKTVEIVNANPTIKFEEVDQVWTNLANSYSKQGDIKNAIICQIQNLKVLSTNNKENTIQFASQLNAIGVNYHAINKFEEALPYYDQSNALFLKLKGQSSEGYLQSMSNIAVLKNRINENEESRKLFGVALDLSEKAFGDTSKLHIQLINSLADVDFSQQKYQDALVNYQKAKKLSLLTKNKQLQIECATNIAKVNAELYQYDLAYKQYQEILNLNKLNQDTASTTLVPIFNAMGEILINQSKFVEAEKYFMRAKTSIGTDASQNFQLTTALNGIASAKKSVGSFSESEKYYQNAITVATKISANSIQLANSQNNLAVLYVEMGQFEKALSYYKLSMTNDTNTTDIDNRYSTGLTNLAAVYFQMSDYKRAEEFLLKALAMRKQNSAQSIYYGLSLYNLGTYYNTIGSFQKAEPYLNQSLSVFKSLTGVNTDNYRTALLSLGNYYRSSGDFEKALNLADEALKIAESIFGSNSLEFAETLSSKGLILMEMLRIKPAEEALLQVVKIRKQILGVKHYLYANSITDLGEYYRQTAQFDSAKPLYEEAIIIIKNTFGDKNPQYAVVLSNLAILQTSLGNYKEAEQLYLQAKEIWRNKKGENSLDFALILNNIASFYNDLGQSDKAITLFEQGRIIRKNLLGENHPAYGDLINNMALAFIKDGQYAKAEALQFQSLAIAEKTLGNKSAVYALRINNLATTFSEQNKLGQAEIYYKEALSIWTSIFGELSTYRANALNNLGVLYGKFGRYKDAASAFLEVKEIRTKIYGVKHTSYADILENLYKLALKTDEFLGAQNYLEEIGKIRINNLASTFSILSEKEKGNFLTNNISVLEDFNSFIYKYPKASSAIKNLSFDLLLKLKSLTLSETKNVFDRIKQSTDSATINLYKNWLVAKNYLTFQYNLDKSKQDPNLKLVEDRTENLEKELTRKSAEFSAGQKSVTINFREVQKKLAKDEVAIEFVSFDYYNKKWTDSIIYGAYLIRPTDSVAQFIPLCEAQKLNKLFEVAGKNSTTMVNTFYRGTKVTNTNKDVLSDTLYNLVWKPLEPYLTGVKKIAYSPAGKLYAVAFNALQDGNKKLLIDKYELQQYTSTREIVFRGRDSQRMTKNISLFGDATFTLDTTSLKASKKDQNLSVNYVLPINRGETNNTWAALPGTITEVNQIQRLFQENKLKASVYTQTNASEQNIKSLSGNSPEILHLATHGFFLPDPTLDKNKKRKSNYELSNDPLLRSGLVLAGGNYAWGGGKQIAGREDGILTAYEISQLDLAQTELVVLSACETALGDVKGSEGVFGLQRSFKMAGVKNMIVSLWQVPDKETAELMTLFYSNLLAGKPMDEAFTIAQTAMRKKYDPFYWAAFVLIK